MDTNLIYLIVVAILSWIYFKTRNLKSNEDEYFVLNSNFIFGFKQLPSLKFSFSLNNILNKLYYHPGIRSSAGSFDLRLREEGENYTKWINRSLNGQNVPYASQRGRHFNFKIILDL